MIALETRKPLQRAQAIFSLHNVGCSSCSSMIERKLKRLPGILTVSVNYVTDTIRVDFDPTKLTCDKIRTCMKRLSGDSSAKH